MKSNRAISAGVLSMLFMGLGQGIINKDYVKAILFAFTEFFILTKINYFYSKVYGLITLGSITGYTGTDIRLNDHSIFMMIDGLIAVLLIIAILLLYILNIVDSVKGAKEFEKKGINPTLWGFLRTLSEKGFPYIFCSPTLIAMIFFFLLPIIFTICLGFTNYSSPEHIPPANLVDWVGLKNVKDIIRLPLWNKTFIGVFSWTVIWATCITVSNFSVGLCVALLVNNKNTPFKKLWRTIYFLPYGIPALISLLIFKTLLNGQFGPINITLKKLGVIDPYFGLVKSNIGWLSEPNIAKITIIFVSVWLGFPYFMALLTGIMTSISDTLYEASKIDGASKIQQFKSITLPLVIKATTPLLVMAFAYNFNNFGAVYFLTGGGPSGSYDAGSFAGSTDILITWIYKLVFNNQRYAMASLMSLLIFLIVGSFSMWNFSRTNAFKEL